MFMVSCGFQMRECRNAHSCIFHVVFVQISGCKNLLTSRHLTYLTDVQVPVLLTAEAGPAHWSAGVSLRHQRGVCRSCPTV